MWVVQPGDGSPDDGVPDDGVPGDGSPDWDGADQDGATGALDGPGLLGSGGGEGLGQGLWLTASADPSNSSARPSAYMSAVSKTVIPASSALPTHATAVALSTPSPCVSQFP